ncbi:hypothetical protein A2U01_0107267, partial [Trifolium medium]|nr:hypothetical protein [Trifolium medium]
TAGTKPRTVPKFYAPLVGVTPHTPVASIAAVPTLYSKDLPYELALLLHSYYSTSLVHFGSQP